MSPSTQFRSLLGFKDKRRIQYEPISKGEIHNEAEPGQQRRDRLRQAFWLWFPWGLSILLGIVVLLEAMIIGGPWHFSNAALEAGSFDSGFTTDFVTAREHIQVQKVTFTGGPAFDDRGQIFLPHPPPVLYVGNPKTHPEIDENWERATWGRYVLITEEEARATWKHDYLEYWDEQRGGYVAGFDLFHTLHCLNTIRMTFWPDYYPPSHNTSNSENAARHMDHCIDQIRQYIMCSGDMTAIGTKYYPGLGRNYVDSDVPHTCRDFEKLREWMVNRYDGPGAVKPVRKNGA